MNLKSIVCAVEWSPAGRTALVQAIALARWHGATLDVVHVLDGRRRANGADTYHVEAAQMRLAHLLESVNAGGVAMTPVVLTGRVVQAIAAHVRRRSADLVVIPQRRHGGDGYWPGRSFAARIVRGVECPTIVVPETDEEPRENARAPFENILCAVDFSHASLQAMNHGLALAQQSAGAITLLHVLEGFPGEAVYSGARAFRLIDEYRARVAQLNRKLDLLVPPDARHWCEVRTETMSGIAHETIVAVAAAHRSDLIVMGLPRRTRFDQLVMGSTTTRVLRRAGCAVLMVPHPAGATVGSRARHTISTEPTLPRQAPLGIELH